MMGLGFGGMGLFGRRRNQAGFVGAYDAIPSIAAAYSSRRLRTAYTGSLLRIRRSSDNTESDIDALANGDLDTAAVATFIAAGSGYIVTWYDQSGNGYDATQTTAASQPLYVASGQNGRPVLRWDGSNDFLMTATTVSLTDPTTQMMVVNPTSGWMTQARDGSLNGVFSREGSGVFRMYAGSGLDSAVVTWSAFKILLGVFAGASSINRINGVETTGNPGANGGGGIRLSGASAPAAMDLAEYVFCNAALSDANRQAAETAANSYWAVYA